MNIFKKRKLVLIFPILLAACAGKGGFDTDPIVEDTPISPKKENLAPKSDSEDTDSKKNEAEKENYLGYQLDIPRRNIATHNKDGSETELETVEIIEHFGNSGQKIKKKIPKHLENHLLLDKQDIKTRGNKEFHLTADDNKQGFKHISLGFENFDDRAEKISEGPEGKEYILRVGPTGHIYYQGEKASKAIPVNPNVVYRGVWHFLTDAKRHRLGTENILTTTDPLYGEQYGALSIKDDVTRPSGYDQDGNPQGHSSEFNVDFNNKTLTGKLTRTPRLGDKKPTTLYIINANVHGNRFSGNAEAKGSEKERLYFGSNSNSVEGGFFGDKAEELAGSFLADDKSIFIVFGAKSKDELEVKQIVDAFKINIEDDEDFIKSDLESFHNISKLVIDGQEIPLAKNTTKTVTLKSGNTVEVTATQLDYTTFGYFNHTGPSFDELKETNKKKKKEAEQAKQEKEQARKALEEEQIGYIKEGYYDDFPEFIQDLINNGEISKKALKELLASNELSDSVKTFIESLDLTEESNKDNETENKEPFYTPFGKHLFVQGKRTSEENIPKTVGNIKYEGQWRGSFAKEGIAPLHLSADNKAEFNVDFNNKTLDGKLIRGTLDTGEHILIDAKIKGSEFEGTAKTGEYGIYLDKGNILNGNQKLEFQNAEVKGGFYGPNAEELGGGLYSQDPKAAAVFGAKKVEGSK